MISRVFQNSDDQVDDTPAQPEEYISPAPRVSVQAFCASVAVATAVRAASEDRRLGKAHLSVHMGGIAAAIDAYHTAPTPNVILLETEPGRDILEGLDELATVCDAGTRVVVIGNANDVTPYRELVRRGISDYVTGPVEPIDVVRAICGLYAASEAVAVGRIIAVVGAKGGVGASTVAHNVAWAIARDLALDFVVIDLDLAFGTASLDYNQDPVQGIANAVFQPERPDTAFMERLLAKCTDRLDLLAAPASLDQVYDFGADAFDAIFDTLRMTTPCIVLDVPHQWSAWTKRTLVGADDILIVAEPDLANMRNAKNMLNVLKAARPNDRPPLYCLNQVGMHKRPEISTREFAKAIESQPIAAIPFDSKMFGTAANNGQMIAQISAKHRTTAMFLQMAQRLTGHAVTKRSRTVVPGADHQEAAGREGSQGLSKPSPSSERSDGRQRLGADASRQRPADAIGSFSTSARAFSFLARQELLELRDIGGRLGGRQVGPHDLFGLGDTALQADRQRQIGAHARIGRRGRGRGAASPRPSADPSKARRTVRDWTAPTAGRARSSARSNNTAAPPRSGRAGPASRPAPRAAANPDRRGYGRGRARRRPAGSCRCRPARGRRRRAAACCRDGRWWPVRAPQPPARAVLTRAAPCRISARRRHPSDWRDSVPGRARRRGADRRRGRRRPFRRSNR